jgi:hypothetical protein
MRRWKFIALLGGVATDEQNDGRPRSTKILQFAWLYFNWKP